MADIIMYPSIYKLCRIMNCITFALNHLQTLQDNELVGVMGGSGGLNIIPAVTQVFVNHFVLGMEPLAAIQNPRIYHKVPILLL